VNERFSDFISDVATYYFTKSTCSYSLTSLTDLSLGPRRFDHRRSAVECGSEVVAANSSRQSEGLAPSLTTQGMDVTKGMRCYGCVQNVLVNILLLSRFLLLI
jgi:hypothetical protein